MENQNNQNIQSNQPEEAVIVSNVETNTKSNIPLILGGILLTLIVGFTAYYLGTQKNNNQTESLTSTVATSSPTPTISAKPTSTQSATKNGTVAPSASASVLGLKEYKNTKYNFSISYPNSWTQTNPTSTDDSTIVYLNASEKFGDGPEPVVYSVSVSAAEVLPDLKFSKEKNGTYTIYQTQELPSRSGSITSFITSDEKTYISVSITPYSDTKPFPSQDKYVEIYNKIILSFKKL